jgi:hypothetical protein
MNMWRKRFAVPPEKGAWVWLLGPMAVGIAAAPVVSGDGLAVLLGSFAAYLLRQPATLAVKSMRRARSAGEMPAIAAWCLVYASIALCSAGWLLYRGHTWVLALAIPGGLLFTRHLWLVSCGDERHRIGMDIAAAGMLALTAPAWLLVHRPEAVAMALVLWFLLWIHASGSVVHMFLRLEQRRWTMAPVFRERMRRGVAPLAHHSVNVALACAAAAAGLAPWLAVAAFGVALAEGIAAVIDPPVGHTPRQLGMRQLAVSSASMALMALGYLAQG